jgi:ketosteroid isomerase-like protein
MNVKQVKAVMKKYGKAWECQDSSLLLECFTKDGAYQESPLAKPYRGHKEIKKFWDKTVKQDTSNIKFKVGNCYVSEDRKTGFAEWECRNNYKGERHLMVGIMVLRMKGSKITFLNEYWRTRTY